MIIFKNKGDFQKTETFLNRASKINIRSILEKYGQAGVDALASATPVDSGLTANSWAYEISQNGSSYTITWTNSNIKEFSNIAILIQYGHATGSGGYVQGKDYINPAMKPIFDKIAYDAWREVTKI